MRLDVEKPFAFIFMAPKSLPIIMDSAFQIPQSIRRPAKIKVSQHVFSSVFSVSSFHDDQHRKTGQLSITIPLYLETS
jgi:hypothetical protein